MFTYVSMNTKKIYSFIPKYMLIPNYYFYSAIKSPRQKIQPTIDIAGYLALAKI